MANVSYSIDGLTKAEYTIIVEMAMSRMALDIYQRQLGFLLDENNQKLGIVDLQKALETAYDKKLDLVLVSMNSNPKVCKIMDYGKFRFEQAKKEKEARKKSKGIETKEIRITPNIDTHDFEFKCKNAEKFLKDGNKVKITVRFRGREMNYVKLGENVLNKFMESLKDISNIEKKPLLEGKNMFIILSPKPSK